MNDWRESRLRKEQKQVQLKFYEGSDILIEFHECFAWEHVHKHQVILDYICSFKPRYLCNWLHWLRALQVD